VGVGRVGLSYERPAVWISSLILILIFCGLAWYFNSLHKKYLASRSLDP